MEAVRKYIDANSLMSVMTLPENFKNRRLEVIVFPMEEQAGKMPKSISEIDEAIQSLVGVVPNTELSLSELREERLRKYETID